MNREEISIFEHLRVANLRGPKYMHEGVYPQN